MLKTLIAAMFALTVVFAATPSFALGGFYTPNGVSLNGFTVNGLGYNAIGYNGLTYNGGSQAGAKELTGGMQVLAIELPAQR